MNHHLKGDNKITKICRNILVCQSIFRTNFKTAIMYFKPRLILEGIFMIFSEVFPLSAVREGQNMLPEKINTALKRLAINALDSMSTNLSIKDR